MQYRWRAFLERRGAAAIVFGLFVGGGIVFVFAGSLARATELEAQLAQARQQQAALEAAVALGNAELEFVTEEGFVEQQARAVGYGEPGEQRFALPDDAPSPEAIIPLGATSLDDDRPAPLEAWLELLFGA